MAIISDSSYKKIPENLEECYRSNAISSTLWKWCEKIEWWGEKILYVLIIWGIISIISDVRDILDVGDGIGLVFLTILVSGLKLVFFTVIYYCIYHILVLFIGSNASMVQNTNIISNVALYNTAKEDGIKPVKPIAERINNEAKSSGSWVCKNCKERNEASALFCKNCAKYR